MEDLSREQLLVVVAEQAAQIAALTEQVAELSRRLGRNSGNSSLPPSSDRFGKPKRSSGKGSARKPGKQPGAPGAGLGLSADPDEVLDHVPDWCGGCGAGLADAVPAGMVVRQVHDVPRVQSLVVEHRMHRRMCRCGRVSTAPAPPGVDGRVCYGPNLRALAVYPVVFQHVPVQRAALLIADLTGAAPSTGWVSAQVARCSEALAGVETVIKTLITAAAVIGVDETTMSIAGHKQWLHVARTDALTAYFLHTSRGRSAVAEFGILPAYPGTVMHDALAVYDAYPATHALCGAHLLRELTAVAETFPGAVWPDQAARALAELNTAARAARNQGLTAIPDEQKTQPLRLFRQAVLVGLAQHPRAPGRKQSKARNLLERLRDRQDEILRFTDDLAVPFTNNGSERDLRPVKTQLKISGCHRSPSGAQAWLRVRGYISTGLPVDLRTLFPSRILC